MQRLIQLLIQNLPKILPKLLKFITGFLEKKVQKQQIETAPNQPNAQIQESLDKAEGVLVPEHTIDYVFNKPKREVKRVFLHCSASSNSKHDNIATIRQWHIKRNFGLGLPNGVDRVGYHFFIKKDGTLETGRPLEFTPTAQANHNTGTIAICLHGGGGIPPKNDFTEAQFKTLIALCKQINKAYNGNITFHGHKEVSNKECPVFDYKTVLNLDKIGKMN